VTAGHTPGCTTWSARVPDGERTLDVVFVCSVTVLPGVRLTGADATWPGVERDFERSFEHLQSLPVDVFLAAHGSFFGLEDKARAVRDGPAVNPFIDPDRYRRYIERGRARFEERLAAERPSNEAR
jgi:metallo-beta-lactamase class B